MPLDENLGGSFWVFLSPYASYLKIARSKEVYLEECHVMVSDKKKMDSGLVRYLNHCDLQTTRLNWKSAMQGFLLLEK